MPIGTSDGEYHEDGMSYALSSLESKEQFLPNDELGFFNPNKGKNNKPSKDPADYPNSLDGFEAWLNALDPENKTGIGNFAKSGVKFLKAYKNQGTVTSEDLIPFTDPGLVYGATRLLHSNKKEPVLEKTTSSAVEKTEPSSDLSNFDPNEKNPNLKPTESFGKVLGDYLSKPFVNTYKDIKSAVDSGGDDIEAVTRLSMNLAGAGWATAPAKPGVGMFGGRMTKESVVIAERMESQGYSPQTIKEVSGLERGAEGMWRKEFSDSQAKINMNVFTKSEPNEHDIVRSAFLGDLLDHPELYKAYPHFKDMPVYEKNFPGKTRGAYQPFSETGDQPYIMLRPGMEPVQTRETLLHEIQHAIQNHEGFSFTNHQMLPEVVKDQVKRDFLNEPGMEHYVKGVDKLKNAGNVEDAKDLAAHLLESAEKEVYLRTAHEVEARNVARRSYGSSEQIRNTLAKDTEDVQREKQIYSKGANNFIGSPY